MISLNNNKELVEGQLEAYNSGNLEMFLSNYHENIEIYTFPNELQYSGVDKMRVKYSELFLNHPELHCKLLNRNIIGDFIIDQEEITGVKNNDIFYATAIYAFSDNLINKVWFIRST